MATTTVVGTTDSMTSGLRRVRPLFGGAALATLLIIGSACSSKSDTADTTAPPTGGTTVPVATVPDSTVASNVNPVLLLQDALKGVEAGYHFTSVVSANGKETLRLDGDQIGPAARFDANAGGSLLHYITTDKGTWAQPDGGEWELVNDQPPKTDYVSSLRAPVAIAVVGDDGTTVTLKVTVSAATLGTATTGNADVVVTITSGALAKMDYSSTVNDVTGSVSTTFGPVKDSTPITAPA